MNRPLLLIIMGILAAAAAPRLAHRWREESRDRSVAIAFDWPEVRDLAVRMNERPKELMRQLRS
ncbi:MAG TPA: hypothetical protein VMU17_04000, partial [Elusimicrobiota bacterium]|nr:hypothetical protein [Elusimicrobiota bacterium]